MKDTFPAVLDPRTLDFQILVPVTYISFPHPLLTGFCLLTEQYHWLPQF